MLYTACLNRPAEHHGLVLDATVRSAAPEDRCLAPTWAMVMALKHGQIDWAEYTRRYTDLLRERWNTDAQARARISEVALTATERDVTLLCFCHEPHRCHRSLLAALLVRVAQAYGKALTASVA
jgi:uncharacterized protein YeaO (DUF488 family)